MKRIKRIKTHNRKETKIMTRDEEAQIVALLRSPENLTGRSYYADVADLVEVLADTGMRVGEALALRNEDICLEKSMITVHLGMGNGRRRVPMTKRVVTILKSRVEACHDKPFDLNDMRIHRAWSWARERVGIADAGRLVLYSLRKSCAQRLVDAGVELGIIYAWLSYAAIGREHRLEHVSLRRLVAAAAMLEAHQ